MLDSKVCEFREQTWDEHLDRLRGKKYAPTVEYAASVDLCAASRILDGCIEIYSPDQVDGAKMIQDEKAGNDIKMRIAWVHTGDEGALNHFELWLTADEVKERDAARQEMIKNIAPNLSGQPAAANKESEQPPAAIEGAE